MGVAYAADRHLDQNQVQVGLSYKFGETVSTAPVLPNIDECSSFSPLAGEGQDEELKRLSQPIEASHRKGNRMKRRTVLLSGALAVSSIQLRNAGEKAGTASTAAASAPPWPGPRKGQTHPHGLCYRQGSRGDRLHGTLGGLS